MATTTDLRKKLLQPPRTDYGTEPDPRFSFANERTFLAWNRTALALVGAGLAANQFLHFDSVGIRLLVAVPPIALGTVLMVTSYKRWEANQRALRLGEPLPRIGPPLILVLAFVMLAVIVISVVVAETVSSIR